MPTSFCSHLFIFSLINKRSPMLSREPVQRGRGYSCIASHYHTRHDWDPLFMMDVDGQLKAFRNSSKLLIAPTTLQHKQLFHFISHKSLSNHG